MAGPALVLVEIPGPDLQTLMTLVHPLTAPI